MSDLNYTIGLDGSGARSSLSGLVGGIGGVKGALVGLGAVGAFTGILKQGFEFNKTMGDSEVAIANVLAQFKGLDAQAAKGEAAAAMRQLVELEPKAAGSLTDLVRGFMATVAASQQAGLTVSQNIDLVGKFSNALGNAAIPADQLAQEMRSIVTANIGADSSLAKILGITSEMVSQAREAGNLYGFLTKKIGKLGNAGDSAAVSFSSLQSAVDKAAGAMTAGLFNQVVDGSKSLTETLNENIGSFGRFGEALATLGTVATASVGKFNEWSRAIGITAAVYTDMLTNGVSYAEALATAQAAVTEEINKTGRAAAAVPKPSDTPAAEPTTGGGNKVKGSGDAVRSKSMTMAREEIMAEVRIAELRAKNHTKQADALEKEFRLKKDTLEIIRATGASEAQAADLARRRIEAEEKAGRKNGERNKTSSKRDGSTLAGNSRGFGGLDEFHRNQKMREVTGAEKNTVKDARGGGGGRPIGQSDDLVPVNTDGGLSKRTGPLVKPRASGLNAFHAANPNLKGIVSPPKAQTGRNSEANTVTLKDVVAELKRIRAS